MDINTKVAPRCYLAASRRVLDMVKGNDSQKCSLSQRFLPLLSPPLVDELKFTDMASIRYSLHSSLRPVASSRHVSSSLIPGSNPNRVDSVGSSAPSRSLSNTKPQLQASGMW